MCTPYRSSKQELENHQITRVFVKVNFVNIILLTVVCDSCSDETNADLVIGEWY